MQVQGSPAVWADFSHIRTVKGRKVCELIVEAPLEDLLEILKRLGNPVGADCIPVAIVPIKQEEVAEVLDVKPVQAAQAAAPKKAWEELSCSTQAGIRCGETAFQAFLGVASDDAAAREVRARCGVESRAELDKTGPKSEWREIERLYQQWLTDRQYAGSKR